MFDNFLVRSDSLKNDYVDGKAVGFSFGIRNANYRGIFLSLVNTFYVGMDREMFDHDDFTVEVNGKAPRTLEEIKHAGFEHWNMQDEAILHVRKEGGLKKGMHHLEYMPSTLDAYGYQKTDKEWVSNPPKAGQRGGGKIFRVCKFDLELQ